MVNDQGRLEEPGLAALRNATSSRHQALETLLRLDQPLSRARYVTVLRGFETFLREWEPHLRQALPPSLHARFDEDCRLHLLRKDLQALDTHTLHTDSPRIASRLPLRDLAAALGSWYVLAGSALGGQVIVRQVAASLGLSPEHGAAYFNGAGADTGRRWREFRALLAHHLPDTDAARTAAGAAQTTFDLLTDTFRHCLHEPVAA